MTGGSAAEARAEGRDQEFPDPATILLVEDDDAVRELVRRLLSRAGYRVFAAASAEEAMRIGDEPGLALDMLVTDAQMPGVGGAGVVARLSRSRPGLPVLCISGEITRELLQQLRRCAPAVACLEKPFSGAELVASVRLGLHRAGR